MNARVAGLLKRRWLVLSGVVAILFLALGTAVLVKRARAEQPAIVGQITPEDLRKIRQAISAAKWPTARICLTKKQYQRFFRFCYRELLVGDLLEIRSRSGAAGATAQVQGPVADYVLQRTTNGWRVTMTGFRK